MRGFELDKFLINSNNDDFLSTIIDVIEKKNFTEFNHLVRYAREENPTLLRLIVDKTYFFAKYLDSRRYCTDKSKITSSKTPLANTPNETRDAISGSTLIEV